MMYVQLMKNFILADLSELMAVRLEVSLTAIQLAQIGKNKIFQELDVHRV